MNKLTHGQAQRLTAPCPFGLVSTVKEDGSTNLMAVSWWCFLSNHPPMLGVCLSKKGLTGSLIEKNGEFTVNVPPICMGLTVSGSSGSLTATKNPISAPKREFLFPQIKILTVFLPPVPRTAPIR